MKPGMNHSASKVFSLTSTCVSQIRGSPEDDDIGRSLIVLSGVDIAMASSPSRWKQYPQKKGGLVLKQASLTSALKLRSNNLKGCKYRNQRIP